MSSPTVETSNIDTMAPTVSARGVIKVHVQGGDGFAGNTDFFDTKVYVIVTCGNLSGRTEAKSTKRGTIVWNKEFKFNVSGRNDGNGIVPQFSIICFTVCCKKWLHDSVLAQQRIPLTTFDNNTSKYIPVRLSEHESVRVMVTLVGIDTRALASIQRSTFQPQTATVVRPLTPPTVRPPVTVTNPTPITQQRRQNSIVPRQQTRARAASTPTLVQNSTAVTRLGRALTQHNANLPKIVCTFDEIDRLTNEMPHDGYHRECSICLLECQKGEMVRVLPCFHVFHSKCVLRWLQQTGLCPLCKIHLTDNMATKMTPSSGSSHSIKMEVQESNYEAFSTSAPAIVDEETLLLSDMM